MMLTYVPDAPALLLEFDQLFRTDDRHFGGILCLAAFPLPKMGASASGHGRSAPGPCAASIYDFLRDLLRLLP